jgi:hypothetical protein
MPRLTKDQARQLARVFNAVAAEITKYRLDHFPELPPTRRSELARLEGRLRETSNDFSDLAINLTLDSVEETLNELCAITGQVATAVEKLENVREVVKIATNTLKLGAAITTGNAGAIVEAANALRATAA